MKRPRLLRRPVPRLPGLALLAVALSLLLPLAARACIFTNQGWNCPSSVLYDGRLPDQGALLGPGVADNDVAYPRLEFNGWLAGTNRITLFWGRGWQNANTSTEVDVIRTFARPAAYATDPPAGRYEPTEPRLSAFDARAEYVAAGHLILYCNGFKIERLNNEVKYYGKAGQLLQTSELGSGAYLVTEGPRVYTRTVDDQGRIVKLVELFNAQTNRVAYTCYTTNAAGDVWRRRVTEQTFGSDGRPRLRTTLYGYYTNTANNLAFQLRYVVPPAGATRYLQDGHWTAGVMNNAPGQACGLDDPATASDGDLLNYANVVYLDYDEQGRVAQLVRQTCGGCGSSGGAGTNTFAYGTNSVAPGTEYQNYNLWQTYRRTTHPSGLRQVEFFNSYADLLFDVPQEMSGINIVNQWITHYVYGFSANDGTAGQLVELRQPSACAVYAPTSTDGWVTDPGATDSGSVGLVKLYGFEALGHPTWEKLRQGVSSNAAGEYLLASRTYTNVTYQSNTVYRVATETVYPTPTTNPAAADAQVTRHDYAYYQTNGINTTMVLAETNTYPVVATDHNGSGVSSVEVRHYDRIEDPDHPGQYLYYWNDWSKQPGGRLGYTALNSDGQVVTNIQDVNTAYTNSFTNLPAGWSNTNGLHLVTASTYDSQGRPATVTQPGGRKAVYAYTCQEVSANGALTTLAEVTLTAPHMDAAGRYDYAPLQITVQQLNGGTVTAAGVPTSAADGSLTNDWDQTKTLVSQAFQGTLTARSDSLKNLAGQVQEERRYHLIPASGEGSLGTNYNLTYYRYDTNTGWKIRDIQVASGTDLTATGCVAQLTKNLYDQRGRLLETQRAVSPATNALGVGYMNDTGLPFRAISAQFYDEAVPGSGTNGVGDGLVTSQVRYYDAADTNHNIKTISHYNYRGQLRGNEPPASPFTVQDVDNLDRTTATAQFIATNNFGAGWTNVLTNAAYAASAADAQRRTLAITRYDERGRTYRSEVYAVSAASGAPGNKLVTDNYFDTDGRLAGTASPGRGGQEYAFDGAGRPIETRTVLALKADKYEGAAYVYREPQPGAALGGNDGLLQSPVGGASSPASGAVSGGHDGLLQLVRTVYDEAGNAIKTITLEANHDATNGLSLTAGQENFVRSAVCAWYDVLGRPIATASYGSGDPAGRWTYATLPARAAQPPAQSSDQCLVTHTGYNAAGQPELATNALGQVTKSFFDALGRQTATVENYFSGANYWTQEPDQPKARSNDVCRIGAVAYDGLGSVTNRTLVDPNHDGALGDNQVTSYSFADTNNAALVTTIVYPDSTNSTTDVVSLTYALDGQVATRTDQKASTNTANVVSFDYDATFRRLIAQRVSTLGTGVDGAVQSVKYSFDALGRQEKLGAYASNDGSGTATNEVQYAYNELGQLVREYQAHAGAVDTNATPYVAYVFSDDATAGVLDHPRLLSVRYPSGRVVHSRYGAPGSRDDLLSRLASVHDDNPTAPGTSGQMLTSYAYNGLNRIIQEAYPQPGVTLDYIGDTPGVYAGFDRFGRVQDQNWRTPGGSSVDRFNYGHDFNGNRIFRRNVLAEASLTPKDWAYGYDAFNQLTAANRGRLQDQPSGQLVASSTNSQQSWNLDQAGNWSGFMEGTGVAWTLNQARSNNKVNEITNITASTGTVWVTPAYDARGNMLAGPKPGAETNRLHCVYDAWNRLVQVNADSNGAPGTLIATYRYDAASRRIAKLLGANPASPDASFDYFYNNTWQTLEVRKNSSLHEQYVWSVRYLDAPVLRDRDADGQSYNGLEERLYYTGDAHFNVTALVNTSGVVVERYEYDPYGKVTVLSSDFTGVRPTSLYDNQVLFSGYRFDPETGLYKVRHRDFHSTLGVWTTRDPIADPVFVTLNQWLSRDPIGERGGKNLYTFVNNNALCYIDDLGQKTMIVVDAIEWDEAWALIYRVGYFCKCNQQGVCGWVRSGNHKGLLEGVVAPWLRFEQKVQYSIEKSGSISFLSDLTGLIPGEWTGAISGLVIELLNTKTTKGKRTMIGELKTIEVIPLPKMKELGECSCKTSNTADTKDELTVKLFAGGVETTNSSVPP